jgi:aminopeptidase N
MNLQFFTLLALFSIELGVADGARAAAAPPAPDRIVLPSNVIPDHYDVDVAADVAHLSFHGRVRINIEVARATESIALNAADLTFQRVALTGRSEAPKVTLDVAQETATFTFGAPIAPGRYVLSIDYQGKIFQQASGFFVLDYVVHGATKRALFTQFENSDARRFLPCWDEPGRKATFTLTATVPADETAVSNMPAEKTEKVGAALKRVHFALPGSGRL